MSSDTKKRYLGHRARLKKRFQESAESLQDYEVLELLLCYVIKYKDVKPMAKDMIDNVTPLKNIFSSSLKHIEGVGSETEIFFKLIHEFNLRIEHSTAIKMIVDTPQKICSYLQKKIGLESKEMFVVISLDLKFGVKNIDTLSVGTVDKVQVFVREVVKNAMNAEASKVIIAHNHPSGTLAPSKEDRLLTERIAHGLSTVEIELVDHLIITSESYYSFLQSTSESISKF